MYLAFGRSWVAVGWTASVTIDQRDGSPRTLRVVNRKDILHLVQLAYTHRFVEPDETV